MDRIFFIDVMVSSGHRNLKNVHVKWTGDNG